MRIGSANDIDKRLSVHIYMYLHKLRQLEQVCKVLPGSEVVGTTNHRPT